MSLVLFLVITVGFESEFHKIKMIFFQLLPKPMFPQVATGTTGNVIRVGFIHCRDFQSAPITVGYRTSAAAASIAVDRLKRENLMSGWEFK